MKSFWKNSLTALYVNICLFGADQARYGGKGVDPRRIARNAGRWISRAIAAILPQQETRYALARACVLTRVTKKK